MQAVAITTPGGPEALSTVTEPVPALGPEDVLIRVAAAGVNGPDLAQRRGQYDPPPGASALPGLEVAGEIAAIGASAPGFEIGQQVMALTNGGGYAEYVAIPYGQVLPVPLHWSLAEAAALPETYFTIVQTLVMRAGLAPGMHVLVQGGAGGIGGAATAISAALGAHPIAMVSSPEKADYARGLGAVATIDRTSEDIAESVRRLTDGHGADRIVELAGGDGFADSIAAAARGAHIVQIATLGGGRTQVDLRQIMARQLTLSGSTLRPQSATTKADIAARIRSDLFEPMSQPGYPRPRITRFALNEAAAAHRAMEAPDHFGKIVLLTDWGQDRAG